MKVLATSDLHGHLPDIEPCELLIIAGDSCPVDQSHEVSHQTTWLYTKFGPWLESLPAHHVIGIGGNHDFALEANEKTGHALDWEFLQGSSTTYKGVSIYGTPYVPTLRGWAYYKTDEWLQMYWDSIDPVDVVVSHSPPEGISDRALYEHCGCKGFKSNLDRVSPKLVICGHIHEGFGAYEHKDTNVLNVAYLDRNYDPTHNIVDISAYWPTNEEN